MVPDPVTPPPAEQDPQVGTPPAMVRHWVLEPLAKIDHVPEASVAIPVEALVSIPVPPRAAATWPDVIALPARAMAVLVTPDTLP